MINKYKNLSKGWRIFVITLIVLVVLISIGIIAGSIALKNYQETNAENRSLLVKDDSELLGTRFVIPREGKDDVNVNIYIPENVSEDKLPIVFNIHGGGFVGGDADMLDTQSDRISNSWNMIIVTVNYTKADVQPIEYGVDEIVDTVIYFKEHANEYNADTSKFVVMGYSAGGYYAAQAAVSLYQYNFNLAAQVLCYPFTTFLDTEEISLSLAPALFVLSGTDPISQSSKKYEEALQNAGVNTDEIEYADATHGFIEQNNPEYEIEAMKASWPYMTPEEEEMARDAEDKINNWLRNTLK